MARQAGDRGSTLAEVLAAAALLTVAMLAALSAMAIGFGAVDAAHRSSVGLFLAEERLEEVRGAALGGPAGQALVRLAAERFPAEPYGTIPRHPGYRRTTEIDVESAGVRDAARVSVTVFYRTMGIGGAPGVETFERLSGLVPLP